MKNQWKNHFRCCLILLCFVSAFCLQQAGSEPRRTDREQFQKYAASKQANGEAVKAYGAGLKAYERQDFAEAIKLLKKANGIDDKCSGALYTLGAAYMWEDDFKSALETYTKGLKLCPNDVELNYRRGFANISLLRYKEAIIDLQKAHKLAPDRGDILVLEGKCHRALGQTGLAVKAYEEAARLSPRDEETLLALANLYLDDKSFEKALVTARTLTSYYKDIGEAYGIAGKALMALKRYKEAEKEFDRAIACGTEFGAQFLGLKKECHKLAGKNK